MKGTLVLLGLLGTALAVPKDPQRIVGGTVTTINVNPFMANLEYNWGWTWQQSCGGSILNNRAILTAAHCLFGDHFSSWRMRVGSHWRTSGGTIVNSNAMVIHPQYNHNTVNNDVAILRGNNIVHSNTIQPTAIAGSNYVVPDNAAVRAIGWGTTSSGGQSSEQLRHVTLNAVNHPLCIQRYAELNMAVTATMLCAGRINVGGADACQGDSGGPVMQGNVQVGITSWGYGCGLARWPGVNARVSSFTAWIQANA